MGAKKKKKQKEKRRKRQDANDRAAPDVAWAVAWLDAVASGASTMSQRKRTTIDRRGGMKAVRALAKKRKVHLLRLVDDEGNELIAASRHAFEVIC